MVSHPHPQPLGAKGLTISSFLFRLSLAKGRFVLCGCRFGIRFFHRFFWRCVGISTKTQDHQINEEIRDKEVRLIGADGEQLGIMSSAQALQAAEEAGLDLVKISPKAVPPVCKVMDYGKFRFEQAKREKEAKKNQHVVEIKEVRMSPGIDVGDFNTKLRSAQKFLGEGNRVKVTVRFRGREMAHTEIGLNLLKDFAAQCSAIANMDKSPKLEGRHMSMFLVPKTSKELKKDAKEREAAAKAAASEEA
jgi:translation initiation factor IF-3